MEKQIPVLTGTRIILRPFKVSDAREVQRQAGTKAVANTTATVPHPYLDGVAESWISKHQEWFDQGINVNWAIEAGGRVVGCISLGISRENHRAEIGYWVGEEFWNKGYCSAAAQMAIDYAFKTLKLNKVTSRHMAHNPASGRVMIKCGMAQEGYLARHDIKNGEFVDHVIYGILNPNQA